MTLLIANDMAGLPFQVNNSIIDGYRLWLLTLVYISICDVYIHIYTCIYISSRWHLRYLIIRQSINIRGTGLINVGVYCLCEISHIYCPFDHHCTLPCCDISDPIPIPLSVTVHQLYLCKLYMPFLIASLHVNFARRQINKNNEVAVHNRI